MFNRPMLFVGVLVAAVVVPYILLDEHLAQAARAGWNGLRGKAEQKADNLLAESSTAIVSRSPVVNAPPATIEQAFRFDLTPQWVASRWPRVSTVLGNPKQLGMRVALVSGTRPDDVAGSLTYYFDEHHQLQRITFTGLTGDPRRLLASGVTPYGLLTQPTTHAARYIAGDPQRPTSEVIVGQSPVVVASAQTARAEVYVNLRRADAMTGRDKAEQESEIKLLPTGYRRW